MTDRKKLLASAKDDETLKLFSHAYDLYLKAERSKRAFFTDFLSPREAQEIKDAFQNSGVTVTLYGGYDDAERVMVCFGEAENEAEWPILPIEIIAKNSSPLSHRDCLGTVLSLGLRRSGVGDIVLDGAKAIIFCTESLADFVASGITKIGGTGVKTKVLDSVSVSVPKRQYKEKTSSLSSMRLDCVVSAATGKSRSNASALIERAQVFLNYKEMSSQSHIVCDGDVLTVRGEGKFLIKTDNHLTRKGRIFVNILKYV